MWCIRLNIKGCILLVLLFFLSPSSTWSRRWEKIIFVFVVDADNCQDEDSTVTSDSSRKYLRDAEVTIMDEDSVILSKAQRKQIYPDKEIYRYDAFLPARDNYIVKVEHRGYETVHLAVQIKGSEWYKNVGEVPLQKKAIQLDGVTVLGSKILMVNRGDTIVYNASALQMSNGSMLDALIRRLPGVELHPGGRITVNGRFVQSLLVNGRDFFRGDPEIALENLPSYYVDNIKVYHKTSLMRQVMYGDTVKASEREDPYVMDVHLKRDYAEGWLGNAEVGYGTGEKRVSASAGTGDGGARMPYMARLFAMRYTNHTGLFAYGNINNLNNNQTAEKGGQWSGRLSNEGIVKARTAGISFTGDDQRRNIEYGTSAKLSATDGDYETVSSTDYYYSTGNVYQRSRWQSSTKVSRFEWEGTLTYGNIGKFMATLTPDFSYERTENNSLSRSADFFADPEDSYRGAAIDSLYSPIGNHRLAALLINRHEQQLLDSSDKTHFGGNMSTTLSILDKWLSLSFTGYYDNTHRKGHDAHLLEYGPMSNSTGGRQNRYTEQPAMSYNYSLQLSYELMKLSPDQFIQLYYRYQQQYDGGERQLYKLHLYDRYTTSPVGMLPSTTDSLQATIDIKNSFQTATMRRSHRFMFDFKYRFWQIMLPLTLADDRLTDSRDGRDSRLTRHKYLFEPQVIYYKNGYYAQYNYETWLPDMVYLLDVRDDSAPETIVLGNTGLGSTGHHKLSIGYRPRRPNNQTVFNVEQIVDLTSNAISMSRSYNPATGVTTIRPENINGNWSARGSMSFSSPVWKGCHLRLGTTTDYSYHHSVDYAVIGNQNPTSSRNTVHNLTLGETLKADYLHTGWNVGATAHAAWRRATSPMENFVAVSAWDYNYGVTLTRPLLKDLDFDTELMMWSRRGYTDRSMNDDELIWNATVSYTFGRLKQWTVKVEGVDMLRHRSSVRHTMNAQGRTETWYKTIPSYWMLRLQYQFKKPPKKNE